MRSYKNEVSKVEVGYTINFSEILAPFINPEMAFRKKKSFS
jgi:hypothetical protein